MNRQIDKYTDRKIHQKKCTEKNKKQTGLKITAGKWADMTTVQDNF